MTSGRSATERFRTGLARMLGGALLFSLPLLMTMEMWRLGFHMDAMRLGVLLVVTLALLTVLSRLLAYWRNPNLFAGAREAVIAFGVGLSIAASMLWVFGVVEFPIVEEDVGKVVLQAVPASLGAVVTAAQFGGDTGASEERRRRESYWDHLFLATSGALFLAITLAPTDETALVALKMGFTHTVLLAVLTIGVMFAFQHLVGFRRKHEIPLPRPWWSIFLRHTLVAYAVAMVTSGFVLWTFGSLDHTALSWVLVEVIVLSFPAGIGAAGAGLLL